jgi:hypothetical protein
VRDGHFACDNKLALSDTPGEGTVIRMRWKPLDSTRMRAPNEFVS